MYFKDFDFENNVITDNQMSFIKELSEMLEHYDFPLIAIDKVKITNEIDRNHKYVNVSLPHKTEKRFDLCIAINDKEIIVFFAGAHLHFDQFNEGEEWTTAAVNSISEILYGKYEIYSFYKDNKKTKENLYYYSDNGEKMLISSCGYFNIAFFNPFIKARQEITKISFC